MNYLNITEERYLFNVHMNLSLREYQDLYQTLIKEKTDSNDIDEQNEPTDN